MDYTGGINSNILIPLQKATIFVDEEFEKKFPDAVMLSHSQVNASKICVGLVRIFGIVCAGCARASYITLQKNITDTILLRLRSLPFVKVHTCALNFFTMDGCKFHQHFTFTYYHI